DRSCNHTGGGGEQRTDKDHRIGKSTPDRTEEMSNRVEEILGHPGPFQYQAHKCEKRNGEQRIVAHHTVNAFRQRLQKVGCELSQLNADQSEYQAHRTEGEGGRIPQQQEHNQRRKHDRRHILDKERCHSKLPTRPGAQCFSIASTICSTSASSAWTCVACGSGISLRMTAIRLMSSETP